MCVTASTSSAVSNLGSESALPMRLAVEEKEDDIGKDDYLKEVGSLRRAPFLPQPQTQLLEAESPNQTNQNEGEEEQGGNAELRRRHRKPGRRPQP